MNERMEKRTYYHDNMDMPASSPLCHETRDPLLSCQFGSEKQKLKSKFNEIGQGEWDGNHQEFMVVLGD